MVAQVEATMMVAPEADHSDLLFFETNPLRLQIRRYLYDIKGFKHPRAYTSADDEALSKFEAIANPGAATASCWCCAVCWCWGCAVCWCCYSVLLVGVLLLCSVMLVPLQRGAGGAMK